MHKGILAVLVGAGGLGLATAAVYAIPPAVPTVQQVVEPPPEGFVAPEVTDTAALDGPRQPLFYRHDLHAGQYQMDCRYCHYAASVSSSPGIPSLESCMGCHLVAGAAKPEVQKLSQTYRDGEVVEWVEVHKLPPFVHFPHMRHVNADPPVTCQQCHGPIQEMVQVYQFASLKMGWCLDCHLELGVTTDCTVCHY